MAGLMLALLLVFLFSIAFQMRWLRMIAKRLERRHGAFASVGTLGAGRSAFAWSARHRMLGDASLSQMVLGFRFACLAGIAAWLVFAGLLLFGGGMRS
jgi:hypothetical protein